MGDWGFVGVEIEAVERARRCQRWGLRMRELRYLPLSTDHSSLKEASVGVTLAATCSFKPGSDTPFV